MKKSTRIVKRILALFLVVLMSIESFAAVVSDNDGSAFITKAEFDSLKNDFQSQIDQYNTSIDSKIDGAISQYLAGITIGKQTTKGLITKDWDDYTIINGVLENDLGFPDIDANISLVKMHMTAANVDGNDVVNGIPYNDSRSDAFTKLLWVVAKMNYKNPSNSNHLCLVKNVTINSNDSIEDGNITWAGWACRAREKWTCSGIMDYSQNVGEPFSPVSSDPSYMSNNGTNAFMICTPLNLWNGGYIGSYTASSSPLWFPTIAWSVDGSSISSSWGVGYWTAISVVPTIAYEKDSSGKAYEYEHIGAWLKDADLWEVSLKDNVRYARVATRSPKTTQQWWNNISSTNLSGNWAGSEVAIKHKTSGGTNQNKISAWKTREIVRWTNNSNNGSSNTRNVPTIGLLPSRYTANQIYQYYDDLKDDEGNLVPNQKLNNGMPLCRVEEDEVVSWDAVFSKCEVDGYDGEQEVKIVLSYEPFENETSINNTNNYVNIDGFITGSTFPTTTDRKCKIKFTADREGYVYIKWYPSISSEEDIHDRYWEATLDIKNCSTYVSTR